MEGAPAPEKGESLVAQKRQEAFDRACDALDERLNVDIGTNFEMHGREYQITSPEDCMVAYAQELRSEVKELHSEVMAKDDYYEEKAAAKLLELFGAYERLVALYAELRANYPRAGARASEYIPVLDECAEHAERLWKNVPKNNES